MAAFGDISGKLGYDIMSPMYQSITGNKNDPFAMDLGEGNPWLLGASQGQTLGQFDPSIFNGIDFNWQGNGPGNSGTLSASRDGTSLGSWSQYDTPFGETLLDALMTAGAAFGGLGLAGAGPWSGLSELFGGAAAGGTAAAEGAGATGAFGELGAMIPSGAELGALEGGSLLAGGAGIGGSLPAGLASFAVPAEIGMAGLGLGALPEFSMAGIDATQALAGGPMGLNGLGSTSAAANYGAAGAGGSGLSSYIDKLLKPSTLKDVASAGMGVFNGINQRNQAKKLMGQLNGMSAPGGAYEQALRKQLERRDAASGRRSQYGPREVELQAKLAELASRNAPSLVNLMNSSNSGLESALRNLTGGGLKLFDIFGGG